MLTNNLITRTDSYKASHFLQYPPDTRHVYSYIEARGGAFDYGLFFGLQMYLDKLAPITMADVDDAEEDFHMHGEPFNRAGWEHIIKRHAGLLPVRIRALPEGMVLPVKNALVTIENTDPACSFLTSYLETGLLRAVWYPTTVATNSFYCKLRILKARQLSCDDPLLGLPFALHDFGARGVSSGESAEIGGAAHLVNFMGSDTFECLRVIRRVYDERMAAFSVPAAEHSTITCWRRGTLTHEVDAYDNMLIQFATKRGGMVAVVSDSYDLWHAVQHIWGGSLRQKVIDSGCTIIIRPDSGDPLTVPIKTVGLLADLFGFTVNSKGYKVLPSCVRVIQGDGINRHSIGLILDNLLAAGFSAENLTFGMGGALLQQVNRDTMEFAMKASAINAAGVWWDVFKCPVDQPTKRSKAGRFSVVDTDGSIDGYRTVGYADDRPDLLTTVWENGETLVRHRFADIRERAHKAALTLSET